MLNHNPLAGAKAAMNISDFTLAKCAPPRKTLGMPTPTAVTLSPEFAKAVHIEPLALSEEFARVPSDIAYWNEVYAQSYHVWLELKLARERTWAQLYQEKQSFLLTLGKSGKGPTVGEIEAEVTQAPEYLEVRSREIQAEAEKIRSYGMVDALRSKRDMLISLGAHQRAEMEHDPVIRERRIDNAVSTARRGV